MMHISGTEPISYSADHDEAGLYPLTPAVPLGMASCRQGSIPPLPYRQWWTLSLDSQSRQHNRQSGQDHFIGGQVFAISGYNNTMGRFTTANP
jgi:hypothetical protein